MIQLNIIYDNRWPEKYEPLINELFIQNIDYKIWSPVEAKTVVESINLSHKAIVSWAKKHNLDRVFIGEDDLHFPAKDGWQYYLQNIPETFDIYAGGTYIDDLTNKNILCGFHLYCVSSKFYDKFLSVNDNCHIDTEINNLGGDFKVCRPFAALQRPGFSANNRMNVNYNSILKPEDIHGSISNL